MVKRTLTRAKSVAAYTLVDLSGLHPETRKDIIEDAYAGAGVYGVRVVEESVNGGVRAPIFGVYNDGPDADRWADAKKELRIGSTDIDDDEVVPVDVEVTDARQAAALREAAAQKADAEADRIRAGEADDLAAIVGDDDDEGRTSVTPNRSATRTGATDAHATNIVDSTLSEDASNLASEAENQKPTKKSKTPR